MAEPACTVARCKEHARHVHCPEGVILLHGPEGFAGMRRAGALAAEVLDYIAPFVQPGISTQELDQKCHDYITGKGATPAPLNYMGYPKSICTSLNHVVCHGIPGQRVLRDGDILNIDVTVIVDGWHGDTSRMYVVGQVSPAARQLIDVTQQALDQAIAMVRPGVYLGDIGHMIETLARKRGYSVVREYCGHGIGQVFHAPPNVVHAGSPQTGVQLQEGMFFTIEPMLNAGRADTRLLQDGWTVVTRDKSLSAQWEHTLGVTKDGCEVFTKSA